ncbi:MAG: hypothetical protein PVF17_06015 [Ignavibacteria bacterium]|jgi:hypothetical protein
MFSFDLIKIAKKANNEIHALLPFIEFLNNLSIKYKRLFNVQIVEMLGGELDKLAQLQSNAVKYLRTIESEIISFKPRYIFNHIDGIMKIIDEFNEKTKFDNSNTILEIQSLVDFSDAYDQWLQSRRLDDMTIMLMKSSIASNSLNHFYQSLNIVINSLQSETTLSKKDENLTLLLKSKMNFHEFSLKLHSLNYLYSELCEIANISLKSTPLRIRKIESGCLWIDLLGNTAIISIVGVLIKQYANYLYRTYTEEGKIAKVPKSVEAVESVLRLRDKLKKKKIDTKNLDEQIEKSGYMIAKHLNTLLAGESVIEINDEKLSISDELQKKYIAAGRRALLAEKIDETTDNKK